MKSPNLSFKEQILKVDTEAKKTSEEFFNLPAQPRNTCSMIDYCQATIQEVIDQVVQFEYLINQAQNINPAEGQCSEILKSNKIQLSKYKQKTTQSLTILRDLLKHQDLLRSDCEDERQKGLELKSCLWKCLEINDISNLQQDLTEILKKDDNLFCSTDFKTNIENLDLKLKLSDFNISPCDNSCASCPDNNFLIDVVNQIASEDMILIRMINDINPSCEKSEANLKLIEAWVDSIEKLVRKVIAGEVNLQQFLSKV